MTLRWWPWRQRASSILGFGLLDLSGLPCQICPFVRFSSDCTDVGARRNRLISGEMFDWIGRVAKTDAQIVFLADVCYGGGMSKAVDPRAGLLRVRGLKRAERPEMVGPNSYYIDPRNDQLRPRATIPSRRQRHQNLSIVDLSCRR